MDKNNDVTEWRGARDKLCELLIWVFTICHFNRYHIDVELNRFVNKNMIECSWELVKREIYR